MGSKGEQTFPRMEEDDRNLVGLEAVRVRTGERKCTRKIVNYRVWVVDFDTHDREGLLAKEGMR